MADETTQTDTILPTPNPAAKPGNQTSEFWVTKVIVITSTVVAVLSSVLDVVASMEKWIPEGSWLFKGIALVAALVTFGKSIVYTLSRTSVKKTAMETGSVPDLSPAAAARVLDGK